MFVVCYKDSRVSYPHVILRVQVFLSLRTNNLKSHCLFRSLFSIDFSFQSVIQQLFMLCDLWTYKKAQNSRYPVVCITSDKTYNPSHKRRRKAALKVTIYPLTNKLLVDAFMHCTLQHHKIIHFSVWAPTWPLQQTSWITAW